MINKRKLKERKHRYYEAHKEKVKREQHVWYEKNKETIKPRTALYRIQHRDANRLWQRKYWAKLKYIALTRYSTESYPVCARCGITDIDILCIDHIEGCGSKKRKIQGAGSSFYRWLKNNNYPEGFQILCANCNLKKRITEGC